MKNRFIHVIAHRGYSAKFPENSIIAFNEALKHPIHGIEVDIQRSADDKFFIIHDENIILSNGFPVPIMNMESKQIKNIRLEGEPIPTLEDLLKVYPNDRFINFELKWSIREKDLPAIYESITKNIPLQNILISSFNPRLLRYFKNQKIAIGLLIGEPVDLVPVRSLLFAVFRLRPKWVNPPIELFRTKGSSFFKALLFMFQPFVKYAFYTVNNQNDYLLCHKYASAIFTDRVEDMLKIVANKG
ncbi:MAG: glycerophosphodiester phosphodiesterase family protein [Spirochaetes bacterium]|jgi:glycerophosphoryl diester phosphodiesterase|nr:glycerophosphodiester phosphodiesterase family protein [Spirochaetota bacterium]